MNKRRLRAAMVYAGYTQKELAAQLGISKNTLSDKINGKRPFDVIEVGNICSILGITDAEDKVRIFLTDRPSNGTSSDYNSSA